MRQLYFKFSIVFLFLLSLSNLFAQQTFSDYVSVYETNGYQWPGFNIFSYGGGLSNYSPNNHAIYNMIRANGTQSSPTHVKSGDGLGALGFTGIDNTGSWIQNIRIQAYAESDYTNGNYANRLDFQVGGGSCCGLTRMSINGTTGNIGIGTTSPSEKLHVNGNILLNSFSTGNENGIFFREGFSTNNKYNISILAYDHNGDTNVDGLSVNGWDGVSFTTGSNSRNERMRIDLNGNVGIGTTSPTEKLDVIGNIKTNGNIFVGNSYFTPDQGGSLVLKADATTAGPYINFNKFGETDYFTSRLILLAPQQYTNNEPKLTLLGSSTLTLQQGVEFLHSSYGNGFGSKIYGTDNGNGSTSLRFAIRANSNTFIDAMVISTDYGNVGIGTLNPDSKLTVKGTIHSEEVKVDLNVAPDYVFEKYYTGYSALKDDYTMPTLQEVEAFTKENKHLPEVPSAQEIKDNGLKLGEMNAILLQKVEELTLYLIEQNKEIEKLKSKVDELSKKN